MEKQLVYVVVAMEDDLRVRECFVLTDKGAAFSLYRTLGTIYGGANVCLAHREIDPTIPSRIVKRTIDMQFDDILQGVGA